jgi:hypothetical protein
MKNSLTLKFNEAKSEAIYYYDDFRRIHFFPKSQHTKTKQNFYDWIIIDTDYARINIVGFELEDLKDEMLEQNISIITEHEYDDNSDEELESWIDYITVYDKEIRFGEAMHMPFFEMKELIKKPDMKAILSENEDETTSQEQVGVEAPNAL